MSHMPPNSYSIKHYACDTHNMKFIKENLMVKELTQIWYTDYSCLNY